MYLVTLSVYAKRSILCNSLLCFVTGKIGTISTVAQAVTLLTCIRELHGSWLDTEIDYNAWKLSWISSGPPWKCLNNHHHHISVIELGHLLTRSGLTYPEVSSKVYHDSFCQLGSSVSLPWVIYFEACLNINFIIVNSDQQMHNYLTNYHTPTCFDTIVSSLGSFLSY